MEIEHSCRQFDKAIEWKFINIDKLQRWVTPYIFQVDDYQGTRGMCLKYCPFCGIKFKDEIILLP